MKRFWDKVEKTDGCWNWAAARSGGRSGKDYGAFRLSDPRRQVYAHRFSFEMHHGYLPKVVRHSCDNGLCVNPAHLLPGTQADNVRDMIERRGPNITNLKLTGEDVAKIRELLITGESHRVIARSFNISRPNVSLINTRKIWK